MSERKCVWAGGHGGLKLAAYSDGTVEARRGDGRLLVAVGTMMTATRLGEIVDLVRGYQPNPTEMTMLRDALDAAREVGV